MRSEWWLFLAAPLLILFFLNVIMVIVYTVFVYNMRKREAKEKKAVARLKGILTDLTDDFKIFD